ncbi:Leucine-rich repeat and calponin y domain-containing protein 1 [Thelohanellus kitauei]|uniref:Leucine-rich repeat and calponin y domain-containing protein 1 n=1 Tax=Thelohanellus kitauei TaxID=669202 RepID=A0A0C2JKS2_THEKT|nr:Leucine-rich repeat and calponin y domain-containing protein 1 [Thelohanellus kitauei]
MLLLAITTKVFSKCDGSLEFGFLIMDLSTFIIEAAKFDISKNYYITFPDSLLQDTKNYQQSLKVDFSYNYFFEIPHQTNSFPFVEYFDMSHNCLISAQNLINLHFLTHLDLSHNRITTIKPICEIGTLKVLNLGFNQIREVTADISQLKRLLEVNFEENIIIKIHEDFTKLISLEKVNLRQNDLESLPKSIGKMLKLRSLNISFNKISYVNLELGELGDLTDLDISSNPLIVPPSNIFFTGTIHIKQYLRTEKQKFAFKQSEHNNGNRVKFAPRIIREHLEGKCKEDEPIGEMKTYSTVKQKLEKLSEKSIPNGVNLFVYLSDGYILCSLIEKYKQAELKTFASKILDNSSSLFSGQNKLAVFFAYCMEYLPSEVMKCDQNKFVNRQYASEALGILEAFIQHISS